MKSNTNLCKKIHNGYEARFGIRRDLLDNFIIAGVSELNKLNESGINMNRVLGQTTSILKIPRIFIECTDRDMLTTSRFGREVMNIKMKHIPDVRSWLGSRRGRHAPLVHLSHETRNTRTSETAIGANISGRDVKLWEKAMV
jgi:hypothetical protein